MFGLSLRHSNHICLISAGAGFSLKLGWNFSSRPLIFMYWPTLWSQFSHLPIYHPDYIMLGSSEYIRHYNCKSSWCTLYVVLMYDKTIEYNQPVCLSNPVVLYPQYFIIVQHHGQWRLKDKSQSFVSKGWGGNTSGTVCWQTVISVSQHLSPPW